MVWVGVLGDEGGTGSVVVGETRDSMMKAMADAVEGELLRHLDREVRLAAEKLSETCDHGGMLDLYDKYGRLGIEEFGPLPIQEAK